MPHLICYTTHLIAFAAILLPAVLSAAEPTLNVVIKAGGLDRVNTPVQAFVAMPQEYVEIKNISLADHEGRIIIARLSEPDSLAPPYDAGTGKVIRQLTLILPKLAKGKTLVLNGGLSSSQPTPDSPMIRQNEKCHSSEIVDQADQLQAIATVTTGKKKPPAINPPNGFTMLFNGKDFTGLCAMKRYDPDKLNKMSTEERGKMHAKNMAEFEKHWRVENGELVNDGYGPYATSKKHYGDFELWLEYKTVPLADSGIYLRGIPQVQIWDTRKEGGRWNLGAAKGSGGLWNNTGEGRWPKIHADRTFGEWNSVKIKMVGNRVTVHLNNKLVVENAPLENCYNRKSPIYDKGPIQLQTHGGEIRWRNIFIREIQF